jgi:hypothetical protein
MTPQQRHVLKHISEKTGIAVERIISTEKSQRVVLARNQAIKRLRELRYTLVQIGHVVGRDHTTVAFALGHLPNKRPSGRGWHRPTIAHLDCQGCAFCRTDKPPALPQPAKPPALLGPPKQRRRRMRRKQRIKPKKRYLIPYAGADPNEYVPKERS